MNRPVCVIPARAGSKRLPGKNMKEFLGFPILKRVIQNAIEADVFSSVYVSSESMDILLAAQDWGAQSIARPARLSEDDVQLEGVFEHATSVLRSEWDWCLLYATGVFATPFHIRRSYKIWEHRQLMASRTGDKHNAQFLWINTGEYFKWREAGREILEQDIGWYLMENGVDINTEEDWAEAEQLYARIYGK